MSQLIENILIGNLLSYYQLKVIDFKFYWSLKLTNVDRESYQTVNSYNLCTGCPKKRGNKKTRL